MKYKDNIKKTWEIIKDIIGKTKMINNKLQRNLLSTKKTFLVKRREQTSLITFFKYWFKANRENLTIKLFF